MPRILLLIILFWLLYHVLKRLASSAHQDASAPKAKPAEKIVQCAQCGLHVPESESVTRNDLIVCNNPQCNNTKQQQ